MSDEAVLRIVLDDSSSQTAQLSSAPPPPPPPTQQSAVATPPPTSTQPIQSTQSITTPATVPIPNAPPPQPAEVKTPAPFQFDDPKTDRRQDEDEAEFEPTEDEISSAHTERKQTTQFQREAGLLPLKPPEPAEVPVNVEPPTPPPSVDPFDDAEFEKRRQQRLADVARRRKEEKDEFARNESEFLGGRDEPEPAEVPITDVEPPAPPPVDQFDDAEVERRRQERLAETAQRRQKEAEELATREAGFLSGRDKPEPAEVPTDTKRGTTPLAIDYAPTDNTDEAWNAPPTYHNFANIRTGGEDIPVGDRTETGLPGSEMYNAVRASSQPTPPPEPETAQFDPVAIAKKRIEREEKRAAVDAEYAKLKPPPPITPDPPFDPVELAKKRIKAEERRQQIDAEYAKLKPQKIPSALDAVLDVVDSMRGTIGGLFGTLTGAAVDVVQGVRKIQGAQEKAQPPPDISQAEPPPPTTEPVPPPPSAIPIQQTDETAPTAAIVPPPPTAKIAPSSEADTKETANAAKGTSSKLLMLGVAAAGAAGAASALGKAFNAIVGALDTAVNRYEEYSPEIAQAKADVEVRQIENDLRRAKENGPELARYIESQGRMQEKFEEAKMKFLIKISPLIEGTFTILGTVAEHIEHLPAAIALAIAMRSGNPLSLITAAALELVALARKKELDDTQGDVPDPTDIFEGDPGLLQQEV